MQTTTTAFNTAYKTGYTLKAKAQVIIEWNWNRYDTGPVASAAGQTANESFPISSIIEPIRPERPGIYKMRVGEGKLTSDAKPYYSPRLPNKRARYKYWSSSTQSGTSSPYTISASPTVMYQTSVLTNKIVIAIENSYAAPTASTVQVTTNGTTWTTIATNPTPDSNGRIVLYRNATPAWTTTVNRDNETPIRGIRYNVTAMSKAKVHLNIIEISARLEKDVSDEIFDINIEKSLSEPDLIKPLGEMNANSGSLTLDNSTNKYNNDNTGSPYYRLVSSNAKVTISYGLDTTEFGGTSKDLVKQGVFYTNSWQEDSENLTVEVGLADYTIFLQNAQMTEVFYQNKTAAQIIKDILQLNGFNHFEQKIDANQVDPRIPYVWFNAETTVWDAIKEVAEADQGVGYFDENENFVYFSRGYLKARSATDTAYELQAVTQNGNLPNIESLDEEFAVETNSVIVQYTELKRNERTSWRVTTSNEQYDRARTLRHRWENLYGYSYYGIEQREPNFIPVWKAEGTVALQASHLQYGLSTTDNIVWISQDEAQTWPYSGYMNIQGETMKFEGKRYRYYPTLGGSPLLVTVKSNDEKIKYDKLSHPLLRANNYFTGQLMNVERGQMKSTALQHDVGIVGWTDTWYWNRDNNAYGQIPGYATHNAQRGTLVLKAPETNYNNSITYIPKAQYPSSRVYPSYGATIIFRQNRRPRNSAGLMLHWDNVTRKGIFVELNTTDYVNSIGGTIGELRVFYHSAYNQRIEPNPGFRIPITYDTRYELEAKWTGSKFGIYLNGQYMMTLDVRGIGAPESGMWGPFVTGKSTVEFDSLWYAVSDSFANADQSTFFNKITGGFQSDTLRSQPYARQDPGGGTDWRISEFGPVVHEVRVFDVQHDPFPVISTRVFNTNTWDSFVQSHYSNAFRSTFTIANASRGVAILNGEDPNIAGLDNPVEQLLLVEGNNVVAGEEEKKKEYKNDDSIRKNGKVELTFNNKWIQTEAMADAVGRFVVDNWGESVDNITIEGIINPALQLGDYVSVHYPAKNYNSATHRYSVVSITLGYDGGISTSVKLRRLR